jgi:LPXTG-motif cell wall-anchored protein
LRQALSAFPSSKALGVWVFAALTLSSCSSTQKSEDLALQDETPEASLDIGPDVQTIDLSQGQEHGQYKGAHFPKIAAKPFMSGRYLMNSYYFLRGTESWEELSQLIYARSDRAELLASWNPKVALGPGALVYYNSPVRATDSESMRNIAADFGIPLERVTIQAGDWLSKIAGERYGHVESWKEIAALNQGILSSPDRLEIGQQIEIIPAVLNTKPLLQAFLEKATEVADSANVAGTVADASDNNDQSGLNAQADSPPEPTLAATPPPGESLALGAPTGGLPAWLNFDPQTFLILGVILLLTTALVFVRRRKKTKLVIESEVTGTMDILAKPPPPRRGISSQHPMN